MEEEWKANIHTLTRAGSLSFEYYMSNKKKEKNMKRKTKAALSLFLAALALLAVFTSCKPDSPLPDDVLDASDLRGQ